MICIQRHFIIQTEMPEKIQLTETYLGTYTIGTISAESVIIEIRPY